MSVYSEAELNKAINGLFRYDFTDSRPILSLDESLARLQELTVPKHDRSRIRDTFNQIAHGPAEIPEGTYVQTAGYGQYFVTGDTNIHYLDDDEQLAGYVWRTEMVERPHYDLYATAGNDEIEYTPCLVLNAASRHNSEPDDKEILFTSLVYIPLNSSQLELDEVLHLD